MAGGAGTPTGRERTPYRHLQQRDRPMTATVQTLGLCHCTATLWYQPSIRLALVQISRHDRTVYATHCWLYEGTLK